MSLPPQLIRIKRKRGDDESPVTFLQVGEGAKRHRIGSNWVYQRKDVVSTEAQTAQVRNQVPVIHISGSGPSSPKGNQRILKVDSPEEQKSRTRPLRAKSPGLLKKATGSERLLEPRRFRISRTPSTTNLRSSKNRPGNTSPKKQTVRSAVFVEQRQRKTSRRLQDDQTVPRATSQDPAASTTPRRTLETPLETSRLKRPISRARLRKPDQDNGSPARSQLPDVSQQGRNMENVAAEMNAWVLNEIGANLLNQEVAKQQETERGRFRPKPLAQRYKDRVQVDAEIGKAATSLEDKDVNMDENMVVDESDGDDWVWEEYVRIPADSIKIHMDPGDIGVLVLDGEDDNILFFGTEADADDELNLDDEDENAEDHYTADYPDDEVDSDDEYGRRPYEYRNCLASDDEEFDRNAESDGDELVLEGDDDDATFDRIRAYMRRGTAH